MVHLPLCLAQSSHGRTCCCSGSGISPARCLSLFWSHYRMWLPCSSGVKQPVPCLSQTADSTANIPVCSSELKKKNAVGAGGACTATASYGVSSRSCELGTRDGTFRKSKAEPVRGRHPRRETRQVAGEGMASFSVFSTISGSVLSLWYLQSQCLPMGGLGEFSGAGVLGERGASGDSSWHFPPGGSMIGSPGDH